jgi:hypothetical protein
MAFLLAEERKKGRKTSPIAASSSRDTSTKTETVDWSQKLADLPENQKRQFLLEHVHAQVVKRLDWKRDNRSTAPAIR